jgi:hypothetical protein
VTPDPADSSLAISSAETEKPRRRMQIINEKKSTRIG